MARRPRKVKNSSQRFGFITVGGVGKEKKNGGEGYKEKSDKPRPHNHGTGRSIMNENSTAHTHWNAAEEGQTCVAKSN